MTAGDLATQEAIALAAIVLNQFAHDIRVSVSERLIQLISLDFAWPFVDATRGRMYMYLEKFSINRDTLDNS